jgi:CRISPR system Cascade subunit CasD
VVADPTAITARTRLIVMAQYLLLRLEGPLMSFGGLAVDQHRSVQRWPATSMLTGLLANALGWRRTDHDLLQRLQARLCWAARLDRPGVPLTDYQTAELRADEKRGWTTRGVFEERSFNGTHQIWRDYRADASVALACGLDDADEAPTVQALAAAINQPHRPLFLGRKLCAPSTRLVVGLAAASDAVEALHQLPRAADATPHPTVFFNERAAPTVAHLMRHRVSDERQFSLDVHAGAQWVYETTVSGAAAASGGSA